MKTTPKHRSARWMLSAAGILILIHGLIEILSLVWLFMPATFHFAFDELNQSWQATMIVGVVSGLLRVAAAAGIWSNRLWGWILGLLMSVITFSMLTLYLPAGAADSVLAGGALILLLAGKFQGTQILSINSD